MVVVTKQSKDNTLEVYSIPEDILKNYLIDSDATTVTTNGKELIDLYKMEYERCAQRYDDLYGAAWTNFSYIALIAGAILTFGSDSFMTELSIFVATLPLLFWWIATFEPLNRYGDQVQARAACIEQLLNESVGIGSPERECEKGLRPFQDYSKRQFGNIEWPKFVIIVLFWIALSATVSYGFDLSKTRVLVSLLFAGLFFVAWLIVQYKETPRRLWQVLPGRLIVKNSSCTLI